MWWDRQQKCYTYPHGHDTAAPQLAQSGGFIGTAAAGRATAKSPALRVASLRLKECDCVVCAIAGGDTLEQGQRN